jgi:hypothetical protein
MLTIKLAKVAVLAFILGVIDVACINLRSFSIPWKSQPEPISFTMVEDSQYNFHVHCPITPEVAKKYHSDFIQNIEELAKTPLYVLYMNNDVRQGPAYNNTVGMIVDQVDYKLFYCGWARPWNGTCKYDARHVCSIPAPMFYLPVYEAITIAWINNITGYDMELAEETDGCYVKGPKVMTCELEAKIID